MPLTASRRMYVKISSDRMEASLTWTGDIPADAPSVEDVLQEVAAEKIVVDKAASRPAAEAFVSALAEGRVPDPIVIARGKPPRHDQHGRLEKLYDDNQDDGQGNRQSYYERSTIIAVEKDQPLLKIIPPQSGEDGVDVYGQPIARKLGREAKIRLGPNVRQDGDTIYADCAGKLDYRGDKIAVSPKLEINGDVDFSVGNIHFVGEIIISRNVLDLFKVYGEDCVTVKGVVEAAEVHAEKDLHVMGGMTGKEKGRFSAGHDITSKYITNAWVRAGHDITVRTEIVHCDLVCEGRVVVENGPLMGGHIVATGGVKVKHLGSEAGTKTLVEVGIVEALRQKVLEVVPEIKVRRRKAEKVRSVVEPLLANQKQLNSEQKEKATELLYQASELEDSIDDLIGEVREIYTQAKEKSVPVVEVTGKIFPGTTIRFPAREVLITKLLSGPLKIECRCRGSLSDRVTMTRTGDEQGRELPSNDNSDEVWQLLRELLPETQEPDSARATSAS